MGSYKNKRNYGQISLSSHTGGSEAIQYIRFLNAIISNNTFKVTICDLKNKDRNMADNIEHQDKGELVTNCDRLQNDEVVVTTPVESRIMSIREKQIMIDRDLADLYGVETKVLNQAVKRNMERFPERFRFQLTKEEMAELVTNCDRFNSLKHSTVRSYAFTEQGVAMLSTVLRSETVIRVSIRIHQRNWWKESIESNQYA